MIEGKSWLANRKAMKLPCPLNLNLDNPQAAKAEKETEMKVATLTIKREFRKQAKNG